MTVRVYVNPLFAIYKPMARSAKAEVPLLEKLWWAFYIYVGSLAVKGLERSEAGGDERVVKYVEERAVPLLVNKLRNRSTSDEYVEAGSIAYFILAKHGVAKRYQQFIEALRQRIHACIEDEALGFISVTSSPALGHCLGVAHATLDILDESDREHLEELFKNICKGGNSSGSVFCVYSVFGKALRATLNKNEEELKYLTLAIKEMAKREQLTLEQIALILIAYGMAAKIPQKRVEIDRELVYRLIEKMYSKINSRLTPWNTRKKLWIAIALAIKLNNLDRIQLVYTDKVVVEREELEKLAKSLDDLKSSISKKWSYIEMTAIVISIISGIASIVLTTLLSAGLTTLGFIVALAITVSVLVLIVCIFVILIRGWKNKEIAEHLKKAKESLDRIMLMTR